VHNKEIALKSFICNHQYYFSIVIHLLAQSAILVSVIYWIMVWFPPWIKIFYVQFVIIMVLNIIQLHRMNLNKLLAHCSVT